MFVLGICSQEAQPGPWPRHVDLLPLELDGQSLRQPGPISLESAQVHLQGAVSPGMEADWVMPVALAGYEILSSCSRSVLLESLPQCAAWLLFCSGSSQPVVLDVAKETRSSSAT